MKISIVIPCRNDAAALRECLTNLQSVQDCEIIIADCSATDECHRIATEAGCLIESCPQPSRGQQMNRGAARATGEILLFSHADTELKHCHVVAIRSFFQNHPAMMAGAFYKDTPAHYPAWAWANSLVRWWMQYFGLVYGDQSVFMQRAFFDEIGGFESIPLMEDVAMSRKLRSSGRFRLIHPPVRTSMRRFARRGKLWTRLQNICYVLLYRCGISPATIYRWYYRP